MSQAESAVVNATWNSVTDVPVTANSYNATGNTVNFTLNFAPPTGTNLMVVNNTGLPFISGTFDNLAQGQAVTLIYGGKNYYYVANYYAGTGNDLVLLWASNRVFAWGSNGSGQLGDTTFNQRTIPVPVMATGVLADKTVIALSAGNSHSLALCSDGTVAAWGDNTNGQLGNNTTTASSTPVAVSAAAGVSALSGKTVVAISAGGYFSTALCSDGTLATWGRNDFGELGNNSTTQSNVPVLVNTNSGTSALYGKSVAAISNGYGYGAALCSDGTVVTWGHNLFGQLGNNSTTLSTVPVLVNAASGVSTLYGKTVVAIAAGWNMCMALCSDGSLASWGGNVYGQIGDNTTVQRNAPVAVNAVSGISALYGRTPCSIAAGFGHSLALCTDGTLLAWGANSVGQLGDTTTTSHLAAVVVNGDSGVSDLYGKTVAALGCGFSHGTARCTDGTLLTWGLNTTGQLGLNSNTNSTVPKTVNTSLLNGGEVFGSVSSGPYATHTLALVAAPPQPICSTLPASSITYTTATLNGAVNANQGATVVSFDYGPTIAYGSTVTAAPALLSGGTATAVSAPVAGLTPGSTYHFRVHAVSDAGTTTGSDLTFTTLNNDATLSALSITTGTLTPVFASGTTSYTTSVPYAVSSIALRPTLTDSNGSVKVNGVTVTSGSTTAVLPLSAGDNVFNVVVTAQDGTTKQTYAVTVTRTAVSAVSATFAAATDVPLTVTNLTATGSTVNLSLSYPPATGTNLMVVNNIGLPFINGTFDNLAQGQTVTLVYNGVKYNYVANYYGGTGNDLVLVWAASRVLAWGDNGYGQIGDGTTTQRNVMVPVTMSGVLAGKTIVALVQGNSHSMALCSDGTVATWGLNSSGHLGNNSTANSSVPVVVNTVSGTSALYGKTVVAIAAGNDHCLALCSDGTVAAWGSNVSGQLGDSTTTQRKVPVAVNTTSGVSALAGKTVVAVSAGGVHSMALCSDGTVVSWGDNSYGQLGNNSTIKSPVPVVVSAASGSALYGASVVAISAGSAQSMALCSDGTVAAWGNNSNGQLGDNTTTQRNVPVAVNATSGTSFLYGKTVVALAGGNQFSLALCEDGTMATWGSNIYGQLGINSTTQSNVPVAVNTASGISALYGKTVMTIAVAGSYRVVSRAFCSDGSLAAWGNGGTGNLGNNSTSNSLVPVVVNTSALAAGERLVNPASSANTAPTMVLAAVPPTAPTATSLAATAVTGNGVTLNGTVNANNNVTAVSFDYGLTNSYGTNVAATPASLSSSSATAVSATLTGLTPGTTYHFRVNSASGVGTTTGSDLTFTTPNNDAGLSTLVLNNSVLTPAFATGMTSYTASVAYTVSSITVRPTLSDTNASVKVNGVTVASGSASAAIPLNVGGNTLNTVVTAQDGSTTQTYTVVVTRAAPSNNAALAGLTSSIGAFTPAFDGATTSYTATVPFATTSMTLTPTAADNTATLKINGVSIASGGTSAPLTLNVGNTAFNVTVTAQDGTTIQTYALNVTRQTTVLAASYNGAGDVPLTMNGVTATGSTVNFSLGYAPVAGASLTVVNNTGLSFINGTFDNLSQGQAVTLVYNGVKYNYVANYYGGTGNDLVLVWASNRAMSWGSNLNSNLGDGTSTNRLMPVPVTATGVLAGKVIVALSAGSAHGLALCSDGTVASWGGNWYGQLGDNTYNSRSTPVAVNTASGVSALYGKTVVAIAAGYETSLALCSDGTVVAWGSNSIGQIGDGTTTNRIAPVAVSRASGVSALYGKSVVGIAAGSSHNLAMCSDGTVVAWGSNASGQLGNNTTGDSSVPVAVNAVNGVSTLYGKTPQMIAAGVSFSLALCSDGSLASWGNNAYGQLGDNTLSNRSVPGAVNAVNGISALYGKTPAAIAAGWNFSMTLCTDGSLLAWGYNFNGMLGDNSTTNRPAAVAVNTASGTSALYGKKVVGIAGGGSASAAFCADGTITTWGYNGQGQLGNNTTFSSSVPVAVSTSTLSAGENFSSVAMGPTAGVVLATAAAPPAAPMAATLAATAITATGATLNGTANASGNSTTVSFEYGLTTSYGTTVSATPATLTDSTSTAVGAGLTGLTPGTTYHYRIKAVSGAGMANGSDLTFTTVSTNANLTGLALNNGALSPVFASGTTSYTASVAYPVTSITLRPTLAVAGGSVKVNGQSVASGSASSPIALSVGDNTLTTVVTAQDGTTTQTYTVTVTRAAPSSNVMLAGLVPSVGSLSPAFDSNTTSYSITVPFATTSMTLTPTLADSASSMQVSGNYVSSGSASSPLSVFVGSNFFNVVVSAQDGISFQTYYVTVIRPALPAAWNAVSDVPLVTNGFTATGNALGMFALNFAPATGTNLMVVKNTGLGFINGTFSNLAQGQSVALSYNGVTYNFVANYYGGTGNDLVLQWAGNRAMSWGYNSDGELGDSTTTQRNSAVPVTATGVLAGKTILSFASGAKHSLALCSDGTVAAWGNNASGQLGDNTTTDRLTPVAVNASSGVSALYGKTVIAIAAGQSHSLALCSDGTVAAWGENLYCQLGDTSTTQRNAPVQVNRSSGVSALFGKTVVAVAAGARHNLALCSDGSVSAWGGNTSGQIGDNTTSPRSAPVAVNATSGVSALNGRSVLAVAAGGLHSLALCTDGTVLAWGNDTSGELGDDNAAQFYSNSPVPVLVNAGSGSALSGKSIVSIVAGYAHSVAQCADGSLAAWGSNAFGQLGDTTNNNGYVPVMVSTASGASSLNGKTVVVISAGARHSMALCTDGTVAAWGMDTSGQLGNNSTVSSSSAVVASTSPLTAGEVFVRAASGPYALHTLALVAEPTPPPAVTTLAATGVGSSSAYLNATVNANNSITAVSFDYGTTTAYGSSAGDGQLGAIGMYDASIIAQLTGLAPATTYHFRVKATSGAGTTTGSDLTFTTLNNDARLSSVTLSRGTLSPAFSSDVLTYTVIVSSDTTSITLTPTLSDSNASVSLYLQSGIVSGPVSLALGDTPIGLNVTAQDGTKRYYQVIVTRPNGVQNWRQLSFGTMVNSGITADFADFDGDGVPNLLEYALNLNPTTPSRLPVNTAMNGANFEYTYTRSTSAVNAGTTYTVEWSPSLSSGAWSSAGVTQTVLSDDGTTQQVKAVIPVNGNAASMFVHLSVTAPP